MAGFHRRRFGRISPAPGWPAGTVVLARLVVVIQVCAQCGTRWNVRDRQRVWCPRCNGTLLAPVGAPTARPAAVPARPPGRPANRQVPASRLPSGFRWIAVRPGPPPPPRQPRRPLGPTPRYQSVPRWGLVDQIAALPAGAVAARKSASPRAVQTVLVVAGVVFALAAAAHIVRYLLMLINRTTLLPPFIAIGSLISGVLASFAAIVAVVAIAVVLTSWLIGRRATAFARHGQDDPRPEWMLWSGCLVPVVNWFFAPLFVLELAHAEGCRARQNRPIALWSIAWIVATLICAWATWSSLRAHDLQAAADDTVAEIIAYLAGLAVIILLWRVVDGFVRRPVDRPPGHRWVIVDAAPTDDSIASAEPEPLDEAAEADAADEAAGDAEEPDEAAAVRDREPVA